ncbi:hypothetical protein PF005_g527 [Phytophthora fragariae]|uniref:Uncharacterized protein n=1 Tax=Phytophthora fragariae TaxID=53985 RepID=A0A6A3ZJB9_9STRA|nr:hypothetical protein PF003_g10014 [Phytophthora fragariae]KAE8949935.1 hypothetical protein PF009_g533 [Phytophthora fragariae]KAE8988290.1 hypothetical protein PF011_g19228 [Phytophthora fragariae]KAE9139752.1 hypothetical protein PF010_g485 [Phytophthora fragariae]KAE9140768.1 hypothetical protein PF007_g536 [Phytophthora fragariae]
MLYYTLCKLLLLWYVQHDILECFTERNSTLMIYSKDEGIQGWFSHGGEVNMLLLTNIYTRVT